MTSFSLAKQAQLEAEAAYNENNTSENKFVLDSANTRLKEATDQRSTIVSQVSTLGFAVSKSSDSTYEKILSGIESTITQEIQNISTFKGRKEYHYRERDRWSTLYEDAIADVKKYMGLSTMYLEMYNSTLGVIQDLNIKKGDIQNQITASTLMMTTLSKEMSSLSTSMFFNQSSLDGWIFVSSVQYATYLTEIAKFQGFSSAYVSTNDAIIGLDAELAGLERQKIQLENDVKLYSSMEEVNKIEVEQYRADVNKYFTAIERATYEYRQTYLRQKRLTTQELYESLVAQQVKEYSTAVTTYLASYDGSNYANKNTILADPNRPVLNLNTPQIEAQYKEFVKINSFIDQYSTLYTQMDSVYDDYNKAASSFSDAVVAQRDYNDKIIKYELDKTIDITSVRNTLDSRLSEATAKKGTAESDSIRMNTTKESVMVNYATLFTAAEQTSQEATISSILTSNMF
jgi:hypothetical protein